MLDISLYFQPIDEVGDKIGSIGASLEVHTVDNFPDIVNDSIALFYCPEFRNGEESVHGKSNDSFRNYFYDLSMPITWVKKIYDLGILLPGETIDDTYYALSHIVSELIKRNILPIIIGGTQDLIVPIYKGFSGSEQMVNITSIDAEVNLGSVEESLKSNSFLSHLLMAKPCNLFNYSVIGLQSPYVKQDDIDLFDKLYFDSLRLGEFNQDFKKAEPLIRYSDILNIDLLALKKSDYPCPHNKTTNGFYSEQICQIAKYAGISDKLSLFSILNLFPSQLTECNQFVAEVIWYFLDGVFSRRGDFPIGSKKDYKKFIVQLQDANNELIFYKSNVSERWWMEVPYNPSTESKYVRQHLVPCNFEDYEMAMKNELPDLWWKTYQKIAH
jgi:hypothetical protein